MHDAPLPHDPVLPRLAHALDPLRMAHTFNDALRAQGREVEGCEVERVKYRPQRNCTLSYRLRLADHRTGLRFEQRVAARLCAPGEAAHRARREPLWPLNPSRAGPSVQSLPDMDMVTWWWPNDAKLLAPRVLSDSKRMSEIVLPELVRVLTQGRGRLRGHTVEVVQYVPEHRVTARVELRLDGPTLPPSLQVYAKASLEPGVADAHALLQAVQAARHRTRTVLRTPAALHVQGPHGLHWQEAVPGVPLQDLPPMQALACMPALGAQLAALHGTGLALERTCLPATEAERLRQVAQVLTLTWPALSTQVSRGAAQLAAGLARAHAPGAVCLHGDLHPRNILVDEGQLALIDLDGIRAGPAVLDLGAWIADGLYRALLEGATPRRDLAAWQGFIAAYEAACGARVSRADLAWAVAWALMTQRAWRCVVNLKPGRWAIVPALLDWAVRLSGPQGQELLS